MIEIVTFNLSGVVRNMGLTIANTTLLIYDGSTDEPFKRTPIDRAKTSPNGEFCFNLPAGKYLIEVIPSEQTRFAREVIGPISVEEDTGIIVPLRHGCVYAGTVRTKRGAFPAAGELLVMALEPNCFCLTLPLDDDAGFSVTLPKGSYMVACRAISEQKTKQDVIQLCPSGTIVELACDTQADFFVTPPVVLKGVVTDGDGHPVSQAKVTVKAGSETAASLPLAEAKEGAFGKTNRIGQFQCQVEPGTYEIAIEPATDSLTTEPKSFSVDVKENITKNFSLHPGFAIAGNAEPGTATVKVHLAVVSPADEPIADCDVSWERYGEGSSPVQQAKTADNGQCVVTVEPGIYTFRVEPPAGAPYQSKELRQFSVNQEVRRRVRLGALAENPAQLKLGTVRTE